jgi:hypothetical protein
MSNSTRTPVVRSRTGYAGKSSSSGQRTRIELCASRHGPCVAIETSSSKAWEFASAFILGAVMMAVGRQQPASS